MAWGRSRGHSFGWGGFAPYVPVAERQARAAKQAKKLAGKGHELAPVKLAGRAIAQTFWGKAWCDNLESYSDFANRLPRGRSYVRNGSVLHLEILQGRIEAMVSGSALYKIKIGIKPVARAKWRALCSECAGTIGSLMELLGGNLSERVMETMTRPKSGLFPTPAEIELNCSCPDWADMCKHVAAVLYGVGARLDEKPELLFLLRHVDHHQLVSEASTVSALTATSGDAAILDAADVSDVFGIELAVDPASPEAPAAASAAGKPVKPPAVRHRRMRRVARKAGSDAQPAVGRTRKPAKGKQKTAAAKRRRKTGPE